MSGYLYQTTGQYFGQLASGAESCGEAELKELGATKINKGYLGYYFCADQRTIYNLVYRSRIFSRILAPLLAFDCHSEKYLYKTAQQIDWTDFLTLTKTFAITSNVADSNIRNSQYAGQIFKDAIVDQFRTKTTERPDVDTRNPDLQLNLYIHENKARISVDLGGGSLHKRGYRTESVEAPMQETLAAAIIRLSGWNGERPLYDPFCGSGTLLCEAFMKAGNIPAAYLRHKFGFLRLPDFDAAVWNQVKTKANNETVDVPEDLIKGSDVSADAVKAVRANRNELPEIGVIKVRRSDFQSLEGFSNTTIVTNPPYGIRMGNTEEVAGLLKEFGDFLKQKCTGSTAFIYYGDKALMKKLGLKPEWKHPLRAGGLDGVLCKYELY
ncbi:THUMP domain-containing class I SAM-dependent RNA methyltransferase [Pontiella sulfatireligans]|uniref:Ribosomal RNA large subunit methyltransferase L n=1 Tax=Pontiella sulfatireligans TaxID=2750658 RepID=A0A6C2UJF7_9BACT|nr:THUMP domain-containing protein [Pontiella sulfatireligans]VGO20362.1 Ribosomal RNA large subunit methyltransferase L [Pontiella sulfatireligans]